MLVWHSSFLFSPNIVLLKADFRNVWTYQRKFYEVHQLPSMAESLRCWTEHMCLFLYRPRDNSRFYMSVCSMFDRRTLTSLFHRRKFRSLQPCTACREHWIHHCRSQCKCLFQFHRSCTALYREVMQHLSGINTYHQRNLHDSPDSHKSCDTRMTLK